MRSVQIPKRKKDFYLGWGLRKPMKKMKTTITNIEHVLRGYENIIEKLTNVGAKISLEEI